MARKYCDDDEAMELVTLSDMMQLAATAICQYTQFTLHSHTQPKSSLAQLAEYSSNICLIIIHTFLYNRKDVTSEEVKLQRLHFPVYDVESGEAKQMWPKLNNKIIKLFVKVAGNSEGNYGKCGRVSVMYMSCGI